VPNDGRVPSGSSSIRISVFTDKTTQSSTISLSVTSVPFYFSLQNMDQLTMWLTILVALMVVCTLIIAATIFVSLRTRQMMWKSEQKVQ
jgi:membrane protein DedA with SNARE-associated domain